MGRTTISLLTLALLGAAVASLPAQSGEPVARTFPATLDQVWPVAESVLTSLGWEVATRDRTSGALMTNDRALGFREFGVYAEGTRHKLTLLIKSVDTGRTSVSVLREVYREERILWMKERKPLPTTDRSVELAVLAAIESSLPPPAVTTRPVPPPPPVPPPIAPGAAGGRAEFTFQVTYRVTGTASAAMLTFRNAKGDTEQTSVPLPWELSFDAKGATFLYLSAQNEGSAGSVTCEIALDGPVGRRRRRAARM